ncbi:MAG TPA: DUF427 domain-containing protein, partial [Ilumatobacteraceae bacterium]|nr:DUF427 domain-containing protein [Ilumatobacteraceae bacterium]
FPRIDVYGGNIDRVASVVLHMATATWNGTIIAQSDDTVVVESNHYFPIDSVTKGVLVESDHTSVCPWKGTASYYSLEVDGQRNPDAVWYYPEPKAAAAEIEGRVAFWRGVVVTT